MTELANMLPWFLAGTTLVLLLFVALRRSSSRAELRVAGLARGGLQTAAPPYDAPSLRTGNLRRGSSRRRVRRPDMAEGDKVELSDRIVQAGIYQRNAPALYTTVRLALVAVLVGLGLLIGSLGLMPIRLAVLVSVAAALAGTIGPSFWLDHVKRQRQTKIRRALPDALDLIGVCLEGGLSLPAALARTARELGTAHPMLAVELGIVERESQMGLSTGEAMRQMARRFDLEELRSLASVITQAERFGSSVTSALRVYSETMRTRRKQKAEETAQKAAVKILFPTLFCIFPGIFIVLLGPAAIKIYQVLIVRTFGAG